MARYTDEQCRICRRNGEKLFLKGSRCYTDKCSISRRNYAPGQHGQKRTIFLRFYGKYDIVRLYILPFYITPFFKFPILFFFLVVCIRCVGLVLRL